MRKTMWLFAAMAGELLGLKLIFMDGGSGKIISEEMIKMIVNPSTFL